ARSISGGIVSQNFTAFGNAYDSPGTPKLCASPFGQPRSWPTSVSFGSDALNITSQPEKPFARKYHAASLPASSSPALHVMTAAGALGSHACPSSRIHCTRTGRPTSRDSTAASNAASSASLRPYEPGPGLHTTRTRSGGRSRSFAIPSRVLCGFCVSEKTSASPSRTSATPTDGAIRACDWNGTSYSASSATADAAIASSVGCGSYGLRGPKFATELSAATGAARM